MSHVMRADVSCTASKQLWLL